MPRKITFSVTTTVTVDAEEDVTMDDIISSMKSPVFDHADVDYVDHAVDSWYVIDSR